MSYTVECVSTSGVLLRISMQDFKDFIYSDELSVAELKKHVRVK